MLNPLFCEVTGLTALDSSGCQCEATSSTQLTVINIAAVPAGTVVTVTLRLYTPSTATLVPTVSIQTYYQRAMTNRVDAVLNLAGSTITMQLTSMSQFTVSAPNTVY